MISLYKTQKRILVIDDDQMNTELLTRRLTKRGYECVAKNSGEKGLEQLQKEPFDLVLLDYQMPGLNGVEVLKELRKQFTEVELPVIMITGHTEQAKVVETLELGANDFISKPLNFRILQARIRSLITSKSAYDALHESERRYAMVLESSNDGLWDWPIHQDKVFVSHKWNAMLGHAQGSETLPFDEFIAHFHDEEQHTIRALFKECLTQSRKKFFLESRVLHADGTYRWVEFQGHVVRDAAHSVTRILGSQRDITDNKVKDTLTGLFNQLIFKHRLELSLQRKKRNPKYKFAVLYLDLDQFKMINDSMGHAIGDLLLQEAARRITRSLRAVDLVARIEHPHMLARMGGDEFTILLEDLRQLKDATRIAERISNNLKEPFMLNGREIFISTSIGITWSDGQTEYGTPEELLRDADNAMYSAKSKGRGRYELFDQEMHTKAVAQLELETDLRHAINEKQFCVWYQPLIELNTQKVIGFEALVRWNHPTKGPISPAQFIPLAEESGLITEIGEFVFEQACQQLKAWHEQGHSHLQININLSRKQFFATNLVKDCKKILDKLQMQPENIVLEITESCVMLNKGRESKILHELKELGVKLAIDDFGTGYSSLSILHQLPFDTLKIDRSFIAKMAPDAVEAKMVKHIIGLAEDLGLSVTAEGIETPEQSRILQQMRCGFAQGYYFSRPLSAENATHYLSKQSLALPELPIPLHHQQATTRPALSSCA